MNQKILFLATVDWFFISHRLPLAIAARDAGYDVTVAALDTGVADQIRDAGVDFVSLPFSRSGTNPLKELSTLLAIYRLVRSLRPDVMHNISVKPVLYGGLAGNVGRVPRIISAVTGFGHLLTARGPGQLLRRIVWRLFSWLWNRTSSIVIVQNPDHAEELVQLKLVDQESIRLIQGAGVDMEMFQPLTFDGQRNTVVLPARMLAGKGVYEFAEVAKRLRKDGFQQRFVLVGAGGDDNPGALSIAELEQLTSGGAVEWWGRRSDMPRILGEALLVVLPSSYGEGMPKALIEALACGRPIITTDIPGCRQLVKPEWNGWIVPPKDVDALETAIREALESPAQLEAFGIRSRSYAVENFSIQKVVYETLKVYG